MAFEGSNAFSTRYPPYYGYFLGISRRQILSVWRKCYSVDRSIVASEGFDTFSARYLPYFDYIGTTCRRQILSVRRKYYASDIMRVALESFDELSPQLSTFLSQIHPFYCLSQTFLSSLQQSLFLNSPTSSVLNISSISSIFFVASLQILLISFFACFSISSIFLRRGRSVSYLSPSIF